MLAIPQTFSRYRECIRLDWLGSAVIVSHFNALDFGLPACFNLHLLRGVDDTVRSQPAQLDSRRQGGDFKFDSSRGFRAGFIHRCDGDGVEAWRQVDCLNHEVQLIARNRMRQLGLNAQAGDGRLAFDAHRPRQPVGKDSLGGDAGNLQTWRNGINLELAHDRGGLAAGIGGADAEYMPFARQQRKGIQVKFIGRFAVGLYDFAIDDELDLGDFGLPACLDDDGFGVGYFFFGRWHKVISQRWRQRSYFKLRADCADIAFHIRNCDIQLVLAWLQLNWLDGVAGFSGD